MKKSNFGTLLSLCLMIVGVVSFLLLGRTEAADAAGEAAVASFPDKSDIYFPEAEKLDVSAPEAERQPETEPGSESKTETAHGSESLPETATDSENKPEAKPGSEDKTQTEPDSENKTQTGPGSGNKTATEPGSENKTQTKPGSEDKTQTEPDSENKTQTGPGSEDKTPTKPDSGNKPEKSEDISTGSALFIGDSRTVGLMEYAQLEDADFFCSVGMSVFNIHDKPISIPGAGKVSLTELLEGKKYDAIYIMLGVNEMGYQFESIIKQFDKLTDFVTEREPEASVIIQANLHVTKSRSDSDKTFNNPAIDRLNSSLSELADKKNLLYLDANALFDDDDGALSSDKSSDNAHLLAKYYKEWGDWIVRQTALLVGEE